MSRVHPAQGAGERADLLAALRRAAEGRVAALALSVNQSRVSVRTRARGAGLARLALSRNAQLQAQRAVIDAEVRRAFRHTLRSPARAMVAALKHPAIWATLAVSVALTAAAAAFHHTRGGSSKFLGGIVAFGIAFECLAAVFYASLVLITRRWFWYGRRSPVPLAVSALCSVAKGDRGELDFEGAYRAAERRSALARALLGLRRCTWTVGRPLFVDVPVSWTLVPSGSVTVRLEPTSDA